MSQDNNKTFCILPFIHLQLRNGGTFGMCCHSKGEIGGLMRSFRFGKIKASDVFNSSYMQDVRKKMVTGIPVPDCSLCYDNEIKMGTSYRTSSNLLWLPKLGKTKQQIIDQSISTDYRLPYRPSYLHLNLSNLCNLKCRMCWGVNSSQIEKDPIHNKWATPLTTRIKYPRLSLRQKKNFFKHNYDSIEELFGNLSNLQRVYFTGGEPMLMPSVTQALEYLITAGVAKQIEITMNTNATISNKNMIELLKKFESVRLNLSLDGVGDTYEYIRFPGKWTQVDENIQKYRELLPNVKISAAPTVQIYNITRLDSLAQYCISNNIPVFTQILRDPGYLAITVLPQQARIEISEKLEGLRQLKRVRDYLKNNSVTHTPKLIRKFMLFTNDLDKSRGQDFCSSFPELVDYFKSAGFPWISDTRYA